MKQNEIARQYAVRQLEQGYGWRSSDIEQMMNLFQENEKIDREYIVLEKVAKYPNHILGGWTWSRIMDNLLFNNAIMFQIEDFYERVYPMLKKKLLLGEYETEKPIWIVMRSNELKPDTVYSFITSYAGHKDCIVMAINEI